MKYIKVALLLPLVAAIGLFVLAAVTVLFLGALLFGTGWRICGAARKRLRAWAVKGQGRAGKGSDESWELLP
jgi:hypothetical protein